MENLKYAQEGTGNAGHTNREREEQKQPLSNLGNLQKETIGEDIDEGNHDISDLGELGMKGGREIYSGDLREGQEGKAQ